MSTYEDIKTDIPTYVEVDENGRVYNVNILSDDYQPAIPGNRLIPGDVLPQYKVLLPAVVFEALVSKIDELERRIETLEQVK